MQPHHPFHRRRAGSLAAAAAALACLPASAAVAAPAGTSEYIVALSDTVTKPAAKIDALERRLSFRTDLRYSHALRGFAARLTEGQARALRADGSVARVERNHPLRATGAVAYQGSVEPPANMRRVEAATGSPTVVHEASDAGVAVLDTGIDLEHTDLNAIDATNCVAPGSSADDDSVDGHGTHVAGIIGARNDGAGTVGVAPGTALYAVKVLDQWGNGSDASALCGIDWVLANAATLGIEVVNMSLGRLGFNSTGTESCSSTAWHQALCNLEAAGVTTVVSAGNDSRKLADAVPAKYPETLAVTAMVDTDGSSGATGAPCTAGGVSTNDDRWLAQSNFATWSLDRAHIIAAPGGCVTSTLPGNAYGQLSGTSQAAPLVAGAAALCINEAGVDGPCAGEPPRQVIQKLRQYAARHTVDVPGYGFVNTNGSAFYGDLVWAKAGVSPAPPVLPAPGFSLATLAASATVAGGNSTTADLALLPTGLFDAGAHPVTITVSGLPSGVTATVADQPLARLGTKITFTAAAGAPTTKKAATVTVTGTSTSGLVSTTTLKLTVVKP